MTSHQRQLIRQLIKKYSVNSGTEFTIAFVAEQAGLLGACQVMLKDINTEVPSSVEWLTFECTQNDVSYPSFLKDIKQVVTLFRPNQNNEDHYATLGLIEDASKEEIKHAYRRLCLQYHPDTGSSQEENSSEKFIKINNAYRALLEHQSVEDDVSFTPKNKQWSNNKKPRVSVKQKTAFFKLSLGLLAVLIVVSIFASNNIKKRAMIAGLMANQSAFVPPAAENMLDSEPPVDESIDYVRTISAQASVEAQESLVASEMKDIEHNVSHQNVIEEVENSEIVVKLTEKVAENENDTNKNERSERIHNPPFKVPKQIETATFSQNEVVSEPIRATIQREVDEAKLSVKNMVTVTTPDTLPPVSVKQVKEHQAIIQKNQNIQVIAEAKTDDSLESTVAEQPVSDKILDHQPKELEQISATPLPVREKKQNLNKLQLEVENFIDKYIKAYEQRNLILFARFFEPDALENGEPFKEGMSDYLDLFAKTSKVSLKIEKISSSYLGEKINVNGGFSVTLHFKNSHIVSGAGPIQFLLINQNGNLLVSEMTYSFED